MKSFSKTLLGIYLLFLLWLILFKTSVDFSSVIAGYQSRSLNLIPFAGYLHGGVREMIENLIVFVPLGLLFGINLTRVSFWRKLTLIFLLSLTAEAVQFVLAIGRTDVTDVIMNTFGGLIGLVLYNLSSRRINAKILDLVIAVVLTILLALLLMLRFLVLRVKY